MIEVIASILESLAGAAGAAGPNCIRTGLLNVLDGVTTAVVAAHDVD